MRKAWVGAMTWACGGVFFSCVVSWCWYESQEDSEKDFCLLSPFEQDFACFFKGYAGAIFPHLIATILCFALATFQ
jgi:hypothetical protein